MAVVVAVGAQLQVSHCSDTLASGSTGQEQDAQLVIEQPE